MRCQSPHPAAQTFEADLAALDTMSLEPLRALWCRYYRTTPRPRLSHDMLARSIAYKLQEAAFDGLRLAHRRKLAWPTNADVAASGGIAKPTRVLRPGAMLVRSWRGETHTVQVLANGFIHAGKQYGSLTQIATAITGAHISGPRFFQADPAGIGGAQIGCANRRRPSLVVPHFAAVRSTPVNPPRRDYSRISTRSMLSAKPAMPISAASATKAGSPYPHATTMAASPAAPWTVRRCNGCSPISGPARCISWWSTRSTG